MPWGRQPRLKSSNLTYLHLLHLGPCVEGIFEEGKADSGVGIGRGLTTAALALGLPLSLAANQIIRLAIN